MKRAIAKMILAFTASVVFAAWLTTMAWIWVLSSDFRFVVLTGTAVYIIARPVIWALDTVCS